jgi:hypothetical protein
MFVVFLFMFLFVLGFPLHILFSGPTNQKNNFKSISICHQSLLSETQSVGHQPAAQ